MNDREKELLESISLKTIDTMIQDKNLNLLAIIQESVNKELFFPEFYEMIYVKALIQYGLDHTLNVGLRYKNFGLSEVKASELFNDCLKNSDIHVHFNHTRAGIALNAMHEFNMYLTNYNLKRIEKKLVNEDEKTKLLENNEKVKNYVNLNSKLEPKGTKEKLGKI